MTQRRSDIAEQHPIDALGPVLTRFVGWTPSSCGLERNFGTMDKVVGPSARSMHPLTKRDLFCIATATMGKSQAEDVIVAARQLWSSFFGWSRKARDARVDKGVQPVRRASSSSSLSSLQDQTAVVMLKSSAVANSSSSLHVADGFPGVDGRVAPQRKSQEGSTVVNPVAADPTTAVVSSSSSSAMGKSPAATEQDFLRARQAVVRAALDDPSSNAVIASSSMEPWMEKEMAFQAKKRRKRMIIAGLEGQLLPQECAEINVEMAAFARLEEAKDQQRATAHEKRKAILDGSLPLFDMNRKKIFVDQACTGVDDISNLKIVRQDYQHTAEIFVVENLLDIGERNRWVLGLCGGWAVTPLYLRSGGMSGAVVKYMSAIATTRRIWASIGFVDDHPDLYNLIDIIVNRCDSKWSWVMGSAADFCNMAGDTSLIGFVTLAEKNSVGANSSSSFPALPNSTPSGDACTDSSGQSTQLG